MVGRTTAARQSAPRGAVRQQGKLSRIQTVEICRQRQGHYQNTHCVQSASTYETMPQCQAVFVGFDARTDCMGCAVDKVRLARISLPVLRFDSLIHDSGIVLCNHGDQHQATKFSSHPKNKRKLIPLFMQRNIDTSIYAKFQWSLYVCTTRFNIQQFYVLPAQCIYVVCGSENRDLCSIDWFL
jgi:hypothetical protein